MSERAIVFGGPSPAWTVPVEAARRLAPASVQKKLIGYAARGIAFRPHAQVTIPIGGLVMEIFFQTPSADGTQSLRFQTGIRAEENR